MVHAKHIPLEKLNPPEFDHRITASPEEDDELRDSIRELGILEPLIVKDTSNGFEIVVGHRRFIQAGRAGLSAAPCIVVKTDEAGYEKIKLHENIKRLPLSHVDQAYTFAHLRKKFDMTEKQMSVLCGKSISYISQHLTLLSTDDLLVAAVHDGRINFSVARELMYCKDSDERERLMNVVIKNGATGAVVQNWVRESNRETDIVKKGEPSPNQYTLPDTPQVPMYPCHACEQPIEIPEMKIVRLCPHCHFAIFSEIEKEKMNARTALSLKSSETG